jgi:ankyrin repeat protein
MEALDHLPPKDTRSFFNERDAEGNTVVCTSVLHGNVRAIWRLVQSGGPCLLEAFDMAGDTCFHIATRRSDTSMVDSLLSLSPSSVIDAKNNHGDTALHIAVRNDKAGAQKNTTNHLELTPLDVAKVYDREGYIEMLQNHGE